MPFTVVQVAVFGFRFPDRVKPGLRLLGLDDDARALLFRERQWFTKLKFRKNSQVVSGTWNTAIQTESGQPKRFRGPPQKRVIIPRAVNKNDLFSPSELDLDPIQTL